MGNESSRSIPQSPRSVFNSSSQRNSATSTSAQRSQITILDHNASMATLQPVGHTELIKDRTIQRMDKTIRKRVRGGINYHMKVIIRGAKGSGKTSLFQRLQGQPIPSEYQTTPQLQCATINWSQQLNSEESVTCEIWDVVDRASRRGTQEYDQDHEASYSLDHHGVEGMTPYGNDISIGHESQAFEAADSSNVNVYNGTHCVIFLLDITQPRTLEYIRSELEHVPKDIPTVVLGNFRDKGNQRKIFKEDIQELLYGINPQFTTPSMDTGDTNNIHELNRSKSTTAYTNAVSGVASSSSRPTEIQYFECSLMNCYGLKALHQYFGIPFLQLKLQTLRNQMKLVESEFMNVKSNLENNLQTQRYAAFIDYIKATGSDIRTGRRATSHTQSKSPNMSESPTATSNTNESQNSDSFNHTQIRNTMNAEEIREQEEDNQQNKTAAEALNNNYTSNISKDSVDLDAEDLPEREHSIVYRNPTLKMSHHQVEANSQPDRNTEELRKDAEKSLNTDLQSKDDRLSLTQSSEYKDELLRHSDQPGMTMNLDDFQIPKTQTDDLDGFYSEDESDIESNSVTEVSTTGNYADSKVSIEQNHEHERGNFKESSADFDGSVDLDDDVIVARPTLSHASSTHNVSAHKQQFLDSDESDEEPIATPIPIRSKLSKNKSAKKQSSPNLVHDSISKEKPPNVPTSRPIEKELEEKEQIVENIEKISKTTSEAIHTENTESVYVITDIDKSKHSTVSSVRELTQELTPKTLSIKSTNHTHLDTDDIDEFKLQLDDDSFLDSDPDSDLDTQSLHGKLSDIQPTIDSKTLSTHSAEIHDVMTNESVALAIKQAQQTALQMLDDNTNQGKRAKRTKSKEIATHRMKSTQSINESEEKDSDKDVDEMELMGRRANRSSVSDRSRSNETIVKRNSKNYTKRKKKERRVDE